MRRKILRRSWSIIGILAMMLYLFPITPFIPTPMPAKVAKAATVGKFTNVSVTPSNTTAGTAVTLIVNFTTENALSGSGNGDVMRVNFRRFSDDSGDPTLDSMTVGGSPFSGYWNTYGYYNYGGYYEIYLDTDITGGSAVQMVFSGLKNSDYYDLEWISLVSFSPDSGGTAYENCTDAGGGGSYGDCTPFKVYLPLGIPEVKAQLLEPTGSVGVPEAYSQMYGGEYWGYLDSDHNGFVYFFDVPAGTYDMDISSPYIDGFSFSNPPKQENIAVTSGSTKDLGIVRFTLPSATGVVKRQDNGQPINNVNVMFMGIPMPGINTDENGIFYLPNVSPGTYYINFEKPWGDAGVGLISPDPVSVTVTEGSTADMGTIYFQSAKKTIKGYVKYPNGNPVTDASVGCNRPMGGGWYSGSTNNSGYFELLVGKGSWMCMADRDHSLSWDHDYDWVYFGMPESVRFELDNSVTESKTLNLEVAPVNSYIIGRVLKPDGTVLTDGGGIHVDVFTQTGMGSNSQVDENGYFSIRVPSGTYQVSVNLWNENWGGPSPETVTVAANSSKSVGTLYLVPRDATISGTVTDANGNGIANQMIDCFVPSEWGKWASGQTNANGTYSFSAFGGATYMCNPMMSMGGYGGGNDETYLYSGAPVSVALPNTDSSAIGVDFEMARADATVNVTTVDSNGAQLSEIFGFAFIDQGGAGGMGGPMMMGPGLGGPVDGGSASFKVPSSMCPVSSPCNVNISTPPGEGAEYSSAGAVSFSLTANGTTNVDVPMVENNATIAGHIVDSDGNAITGVSGMIFADRFETMSFTETWINTADGSYSVTVAPGTWSMGYFIDPTLGYMAGGMTDNKVTAINDQTVTKNLTLREIDSWITVTVLDPSGNPMAGAFVDVSTSSGLGGIDDGPMGPGPMGPGPMMGPMMMGPGMMGEMSGSDGTVTIGVPGGTTYYVSANLPIEMSYISPSKEAVTISSGETKTLTMQFKESDATISGSVTIDGSATYAFVTAWSETGGSSQGFAFGGAYTLNVTQGDNWHVNAKSKIGSDFYKSGEKVVAVDEAMETLNLELSLAAANVPDPVTANFSPGNPAVVSLSDGTTINIPAGSIKSGGNNITLTATPTVELADTADAKPVSYGISLEAIQDGTTITSNFNSNVTITQPYDEDLITDLGLTESELGNSYWDENTGTWKAPENVTVNTEQNVVTTAVNHFTDFAITSADISAPRITVTSPEDDATVTVNSVLVEGTVSDPNATVTIVLGGISIGTVTINSDTGAFSETVSGLSVGSNTITVDAENGVGTASTVTRTVTYQTADGADDTDEGPSTVATGVELSLVTIPKDGGPQVRTFDNEGNLLGTFFAYNEALRGEFSVVTVDIDGDGDKEIITYPGEGFGPHVRVFDQQGNLLDHFFAYQETFKGGVEVKVADIDGDNLADLVVRPKQDGGSNIRVYKYNTTTEVFELLDWVMVYQEGFRGPLNMVTTDVDGDGKAEIVTVPAENGGPNVRVYTFNTTTEQLELVDWFMAYAETFTGGVNISVGNVYGDANKEIVVAPADQGGPNVRVYEYNTDTETFSFVDWFWAYQQTYRGGVELKLVDMNNDGLSDIITVPTNGSTNVRVFNYDADTEQFTLLDWFWAYTEASRDGINLAISNIDGDDYNEIVTTPANDSGPNVRLYEYNAETEQIELLDWVMAYEDTFRGTIQVKIADLEGDGDSEVITSPLTNGGPNVRIHNYTDNNLAVQYGFMAYTEAFRGGVKVTTGR